MIAKSLILLAVVAAAAYAQQYGYPPSGKPDELQYPPQPYNFGYDSSDEFGTSHFRKETGDSNGRVQGSYGYKDAQGVERIVEYVADENGYRAQIKTNEPGTEAKSPADIELLANPIHIPYVPPPKQQAPYPQAGAPVPQY